MVDDSNSAAKEHLENNQEPDFLDFFGYLYSVRLIINCYLWLTTNLKQRKAKKKATKARKRSFAFLPISAPADQITKQFSDFDSEQNKTKQIEESDSSNDDSFDAESNQSEDDSCNSQFQSGSESELESKFYSISVQSENWSES